MSSSGLNNFGAFIKARKMCWRLVGQQVASADSTCANIEEGYGRKRAREYRQFLSFARGSAQETRGRDERMSHWLSAETIKSRTALGDEIIGILTTTITRMGETGLGEGR